MIIWRRENWFDNDFQSSRNQFLGSDSKSFVWNGDDLPVDVLFSTFVTTAPVDVTLPISFAWTSRLVDILWSSRPSSCNHHTIWREIHKVGDNRRSAW